jgi:hypothetical protein
MVEADPWSVLGLDRSATYEEARLAYRRRSRLVHPDRHPEADPELRAEAERAMAALNLAWQTLEQLLSGPSTQRSRSNGKRSSDTNARPGRSRTSERPGRPSDLDLDGYDTFQDCVDWVLGGLIEGGELQGDPLSYSEIERALEPIAKEARKNSFDLWLTHRTTAMRAALDADASDGDGSLAIWVHCYRLLDDAQCNKVIMMMLDELLGDD